MKKLSNVFVTFAIIASVVIFTNNCGGGGSGGGSSKHTLSTVFKEGNPASAMSQVMRAGVKPNNVQGLFFRQFEITAYQYSPGFSHAGSLCGSNDSVDWAFNSILYRGAIQDFVMKPGTTFDFAAANANWNTGYEYPDNMDDVFRASFNSFRVDFMEIFAHRLGVIIDDQLMGYLDEDGYANLKAAYPEFANVSWVQVESRVETMPGYGQDFSLIFARQDWFPEPVLIQIEHDQFLHPDTYNKINWSSRALSTFQKDMLESMIANGQPRGYYNLVIVPYDGPIVMSLDGKDNGGQTDPSKVFSNPVITVNWDLTYENILSDATRALYDAQGTLTPLGDPSNPFGDMLEYKLTNNVPLGLSVTVAEAPAQE